MVQSRTERDCSITFSSLRIQILVFYWRKFSFCDSFVRSFVCPSVRPSVCSIHSIQFNQSLFHVFFIHSLIPYGSIFNPYLKIAWFLDRKVANGSVKKSQKNSKNRKKARRIQYEISKLPLWIHYKQRLFKNVKKKSSNQTL